MVRKRMVSTVMSLMMAAAVLTTVPVTNNVKAADKEITSGGLYLCERKQWKDFLCSAYKL